MIILGIVTAIVVLLGLAALFAAAVVLSRQAGHRSWVIEAVVLAGLMLAGVAYLAVALIVG